MNAVNRLFRVTDDIRGHKYDQQRMHIASAVEYYVEEYGVSEAEAYQELTKMTETAWKDLNQELILSPTGPPMHVLERVLNCICIVEVIYKNIHGYTHAEIEFKDHIHLLLIDPINI
ncbi:hypothetical protein GIB67_023632 [Kingdonia uniflora]|uniref:Terpene synthase metal-binding domain-containing protein n=1 Tax=Kingdonia uniflora TaxID=39325 RepID=A0A7J7L560_9MAGN|nr:hypothetical protein GIB67_023632 [Kingdonia uniflora]